MEDLVKRFSISYEKHEESEIKLTSNYSLLLCHMCNFHIFHPALMFDLLTKLVSNFSPLDVELILLVLKGKSRFLHIVSIATLSINSIAQDVV